MIKEMRNKTGDMEFKTHGHEGAVPIGPYLIILLLCCAPQVDTYYLNLMPKTLPSRFVGRGVWKEMLGFSFITFRHYKPIGKCTDWVIPP